MKITTVAEMRTLENIAIEHGASETELIRAAGKALAAQAMAILGEPLQEKTVAVLCGRGKNGADGFIAARLLSEVGAQVRVLLAGKILELPDVPRMRAAEMGLPIVECTEEMRIDLSGFSVIIDALLGTGIKEAPHGVIARCIEAINEAKTQKGVPVVSADIPSGVDADTGKVMGVAVEASQTVVFGALKPGNILYPGATMGGQQVVRMVGLERYLETATIRREITTEQWVRASMPQRVQGRDTNKGTYGKLLVVAGSWGMAGAAVLTATAALRAGAGLVYLAVPGSIVSTVAVMCPEVVIRPLPDENGTISGSRETLGMMQRLIEEMDAVAVGPGMTVNPGVGNFLRNFLPRINVPYVIDADGLMAIADYPQAVRMRGTKGAIITPHPGEMAKLLGVPVAQIQEDRQAAVTQTVTKWGGVTLLKGARTLIGDGESLYFNREGSPTLATAGSGDVLTGVIGALLAQGMTTTNAARAGAYLHAVAGELCEQHIGCVGVLATEIRDMLPEARRQLDKGAIQDEFETI
jgi:ADP-dependent NAD(P)H-hydrate dehydratase / NAD(P)H-hydrate epimerase